MTKLAQVMICSALLSISAEANEEISLFIGSRPIVTPQKIEIAEGDSASFSVTLGDLLIDMVWCPPGTFTMGSPTNEIGHEDTEIQHKVSFSKGFWMGKYEVTQSQYQSVMGNNPSYWQGKKLPVDSVSWNDCTEFCEKLNEYAPYGYKFTLPTEEQWEYACRAGTTTALNSGKNLTDRNECSNMDKVGWYYYNAEKCTHEVGKKLPNRWGLYDMHGNIMEWCCDQIGEAYRTLRGGSCVSRASRCRSAHSEFDVSDTHYRGYGFRVALVADREDAPDLKAVPLSYQWLKNGKEIDGATGDSFSIEVAETGDDAFYSALIDNGVQEIESEQAELIVRQRLHFLFRKLGGKHDLENIQYELRILSTDGGFLETSTDLVNWEYIGYLPYVGVITPDEQNRFFRARNYVVGRTTTIQLSEEVTMDMVLCPSGRFMMGSSEDELGWHKDEIQHPVILSKGFWIGKYEVTQAQYDAIMGTNPSKEKDPNNAVNMVSWGDCMYFCEVLNLKGLAPEGLKFVLPTEAQWEYACRAGTTTALNSGKDILDVSKCANMDEVGWYYFNSAFEMHSVGEKQPNAWGIHDMHGNVAEWCLDWYGKYSTGLDIDPVGAEEGSLRVYRGGSRVDYAYSCRSATRGNGEPGKIGENLGFRVALIPVE